MINERLSRDIEVGAKARIRYRTDVIETDGGGSVRNERWRYPLLAFEFDIEPGDPYDDSAEYIGRQTLAEFVNLYHCAGGRGETFLFRHWADYRAVGNYIGEGDGTTTEFQLYRTYEIGLSRRMRKITRPVAGTVVAYVDGIETAVTVNAETGVITFGAAPAGSTVITADFEFDLPVRFDSDDLEVVALGLDLDRPVSITLVEERE